MAGLVHRPIDRDGSPTGAGFCRLSSKHPIVGSGGVRQIRHTPRYRVASVLGAESTINQRFGVAYAALSRWWRLHTVRCISRMLSAYRSRLALGLSNSAIPGPSPKGGR